MSASTRSQYSQGSRNLDDFMTFFLWTKWLIFWVVKKGWSRDNCVIIVRFINYDNRQFPEVNLTLGLRIATRKVSRWTHRKMEFFEFLKFLRSKEEVWTNTLWYNVTVLEFNASFWAEISEWKWISRQKMKNHKRVLNIIIIWCRRHREEKWLTKKHLNTWSYQKYQVILRNL